eukprot:SAG31_NODE_6466_length_2006_cov_2.304143_1_plen_174_part_00
MDEISFKVVSGEGKLWATHSGNPAADMNKNPVHGGIRAAYHGLARAYIRSSADRATPPAHRLRLREIDMDGGVNTFISDPSKDSTGTSVPGIVVSAVLKSCEGKAQCPSDKLSTSHDVPSAHAFLISVNLFLSQVCQSLCEVKLSPRAAIPVTTDLGELPRAVAERGEANMMK